MESNSPTAFYYSLQGDTADRGAGGKFRRQPPRKPPSTPYARPQQSQSLRGRWLSKLVDPAYRLISGGATRIFPSFFSKSPAINSLPPPSTQTLGKLEADVEQNANSDNHPSTSAFDVPGSTEVAGASRTADRSNTVSDFDDHSQFIKVDVNDEDGLSKIEQLMKDKTFSRDEFNRLIEILKSRAVDLPNVDQESKELSLPEEDAERPMNSRENQGKPTEEKPEDLDKSLWGSLTPLPQSITPDEPGSSPVELARAYMENRRLDTGLSSKSIILKDRRQSLLTDDFASKSLVSSPSAKPSTCWPGAVVQSQHGNVTPQSQRGRFGLHNFPRTPYSRTSYSKSRYKLTNIQGDSGSFPNSSFTALQQSQTPIYSQSRSNTLDNGRGYVGPIRRMQHKVATETSSRGSLYSNSLLDGPSKLENSNVSKVSFPAHKMNLEPGTPSSSTVFKSVESKTLNIRVSTPMVHPHSSQVARTILEHLDRNLPTPKQKSNELKLATLWKESQSSNAATFMQKKPADASLPYLGYSKSKDQPEKESPAQRNESRRNSISVTPSESVIAAKDAVNNASSASGMKADGTITIFGGYAKPSLGFKKVQDSQIKSTYEGFSKTVSSTAGSEFLQKPSSHSLSNKPVLPSISISKSDQKWMFSLDNSTGFTFPVSASSGASSEPPTPSVMPSLSASGLHHPRDKSPIPSYSFGSKRLSPALVFSFPSTSIAANHVDASDIKFSFGSDGSKRISFSAIGENAICY